jgi:uncharacterized membrane protein YeaQ/YmgE (transglycosylase-associated protein family)
VAFTAVLARKRAHDIIAGIVTEGFVMGIIWVIIIGFIAGIIAKLLMPGPNNPSGFIMTAVLGIVGAFIATFIGQAIGHYGPDQGAGLITSTVGAVVVLFIWHRIAAARTP